MSWFTNLFRGPGRRRSQDNIEGFGAGEQLPPPPKQVRILATGALVIVGGASTFVLGLAAIRGDDSATSQIGVLATLTIGALVALAGGKHDG